MKLFVLLMLLIMPWVLMAQPGGGNPPTPGDPVPITGVEWLLLGGGILGASRIYMNFRNGKRKT